MRSKGGRRVAARCSAPDVDTRRVSLLGYLRLNDVDGTMGVRYNHVDGTLGVRSNDEGASN
jgi:hypothetical protein